MDSQFDFSDFVDFDDFPAKTENFFTDNYCFDSAAFLFRPDAFTAVGV